MDPKQADILDRFAQFALIAAREAVIDSGIEFDAALRESSAVMTGSCLGGKSTEDDGFRGLYALNQTRFPPLSVPKAMANAGASRISLEYGITGPVYTISTACSSANHAIGQAFWMVRNGVTEIAIAGGSEAPFSLGHLKAWEAMRVVSQTPAAHFRVTATALFSARALACWCWNRSIELAPEALVSGAKFPASVCRAMRAI